MRTRKPTKNNGDLGSRDARVRERALSKLPQSKESTRVLARFLRDSDGFVRNAALERLHGWDAHHCLRLILPNLGDPFDIARVSALECVAAWGTAAHRRFVRPRLSDTSPLVRAYAIWALSQLGGRELELVLRRRLKSERHPIPRTALHEALFGLCGDDRHLRALLRSLTSVNHRVACFAARSLSNCVTLDNRPLIITALRQARRLDKRLGVRETAGRALDSMTSSPASG